MRGSISSNTIKLRSLNKITIEYNLIQLLLCIYFLLSKILLKLVDFLEDHGLVLDVPIGQRSLLEFAEVKHRLRVNVSEAGV